MNFLTPLRAELSLDDLIGVDDGLLVGVLIDRPICPVAKLDCLARFAAAADDLARFMAADPPADSAPPDKGEDGLGVEAGLGVEDDEEEEVGRDVDVEAGRVREEELEELDEEELLDDVGLDLDIF